MLGLGTKKEPAEYKVGGFRQLVCSQADPSRGRLHTIQ